MRRYYEEEYDRRIAREAQEIEHRKHHFVPTQGHVVHLTRYEKAYAEKGEYIQRCPSLICLYFFL